MKYIYVFGFCSHFSMLIPCLRIAIIVIYLLSTIYLIYGKQLVRIHVGNI